MSGGNAHIVRMYRRTLLAMTFLPAIRAAYAQSTAPTAQDRIDLARIEAYLETLRSLKSRFLQVAPDGSTSGGAAWLQRPGRMRFQYDPPSPLLLVAGGGLVVFHDSELEQTSNFPLGSTPLGLLLSDHLRLSGEVTVLGVARQPGQLQVTINRTSSPGDGTITLVFSDAPLQLRQWAVVDSQRKETRVSLFNVELGGQFDQSLFYFADPRKLPPRYSPGNGG